MEGFSHKLPVLVRQLAHMLRTLSPAASDFARVKDDLVRKYRNIHFKPHKHASYLRLYALKPGTWPVEAVAAALQQLELEDVMRFRDDMLRTLCLEVLVHGNVTAEAATAMADEAWGELGGEPLPVDARPVDSVHIVPRGNAHLFRCGTCWDPVGILLGCGGRCRRCGWLLAVVHAQAFLLRVGEEFGKEFGKEQ